MSIAEARKYEAALNGKSDFPHLITQVIEKIEIGPISPCWIRGQIRKTVKGQDRFARTIHENAEILTDSRLIRRHVLMSVRLTSILTE